MYAPPKAREGDVSWIPASGTGIITGYLNGHSELWDSHQPPDDMGDRIIDLILNKNLTCVNDGSATRVNRGTAGLSSPDVTLATANLANKIKWATVEDLGSDHLPIIFEVGDEYNRRHEQKQRRRRWRRRNADWEAFTRFAEEGVEALQNQDPGPLKSRVRRFNSLLTEAGRKHVGKTAPRGNSCWMNATIRTALRK